MSNIKSYLNTKTILIIDSNKDWLLLYDKFKNKQVYKPNFFKIYEKDQVNISINLLEDTWAEEAYYKDNLYYKDYKFIHSKDILNKNFRLWKLIK